MSKRFPPTGQQLGVVPAVHPGPGQQPRGPTGMLGMPQGQLYRQSWGPRVSPVQPRSGDLDNRSHGVLQVCTRAPAGRGSDRRKDLRRVCARHVFGQPGRDRLRGLRARAFSAAAWPARVSLVRCGQVPGRGDVQHRGDSIVPVQRLPGRVLPHRNGPDARGDSLPRLRSREVVGRGHRTVPAL